MDDEQEILTMLWNGAKKPSRNVATLTHKMRATFAFLETPWDDKARQIIGALVAVNASHMHTTIWAALFQQLRETNDPIVKVYILKQFANICWTVPLTQATNAFRAFALEIRPLLSDDQIVANSAFQKYFSTIISYLKNYAEEGLSHELFNILFANLVKWKRVEAIRGVANVIAELSMRVPHCPPVETLLPRAKQKLHLLGYVILLETFIAADTHGKVRSDEQHLQFFCKELDYALFMILQSTTENVKAIPPFVSAYRRLKFRKGTWESVHSAKFSDSIFHHLELQNANKLLACPFLQFLQTTSHNWYSSKATVWKLTESTDPFVRANAFLALSSKSHLLNASQKQLTIAELMERLYRFIETNCSYTIVAILKFLKTLIFSSTINLPTQRLYLLQLLHICCRYGKNFSNDSAAQIELVNLFSAASLVPEAVQQFTIRLFYETNDRAVAAKAFQTLIYLSASCKLDDETGVFNNFSTFDNFLEGSLCVGQTRNDTHMFTSKCYVPPGEVLFEILLRRFLRLSCSESNNGFGYIVGSDAVKQLCNEVHIRKRATFTFQHSTLIILLQILLSQNTLSSDVYIAVIEAVSACINYATAGTCVSVDLFAPLVQHAWSVLVDSAAALYPEFSPTTKASACRFFCCDATPLYLHELIIKCKDIALSNEVALYSSVYFQIIECNFCLLNTCVYALRSSPLFVHEIMHELDHIFRCCNTFFHYAPKHTLRFITTFLDAAVSYEAESEFDACCAKQMSVYFSNCCSSVISQAITLNILSYCTDLCSFLMFCLQHDGEKTIGVFSELIADNWSIIADLFALCKRDSVNDGSNDEGSSVLSVLQLVRSLYWSSYFPRVAQFISLHDINRIAHFSQKWKWFPEKGECCQIIADLRRLYENNINNTVDSMAQSVCTYNSTRSFFEFFENVVLLYNTSSSETQEKIKEYLFTQRNCESHVSLAAIDNSFISRAVDFVLTTPVDESVLEVLLLIIHDCKMVDIPPLEFHIADEVFGASDELIEEIIVNYRWGWFWGPKTVQMLSGGALVNGMTHLGEFVTLRSQLPIKQVIIRSDHTSSIDMFAHKALSAPLQLFPGICAVDMLLVSSNDRFTADCNAEEVLFSDSPLALQTLHNFFVNRDNFEDLLHPPVILLFARYISVVRKGDMFLWELSEWASLLRSWVEVTVATQVESEQWGWLQLSCWILFHRLYNHLYTMAKNGHPKYPKENGVLFFEELRTIYLQLSNCFLCCNASTVDDVAMLAVRYALKNPSIFSNGGIYEEIFWCIVRTCLESVWVVLNKVECASLHDPEVVMLLCRTHRKIGLPVQIQRKVHMIFSTRLRNYGPTNTDYDLDTQRHMLWLLSSFGQHLYFFTTKGEQSGSVTMHVSGNSRNERSGIPAIVSAQQSPGFTNDEVKEWFVFRSAVAHDLFKLAQKILRMPSQAPPSTVFDMLGLLCDISYLTAISSVSVPFEGTSCEVEQLYLLVTDFLAIISPLSTSVSLQPTAHCLRNLLDEFPRPRRASSFCDEYALSLVTTTLSGTLASWLCRSASLSVLPAQIPCTLAVYFPSLIRLDLPLYIAALRCVESIATYGATAEVRAVYKVVLPRLSEDLVDVQWDLPVAASWNKALLVLLGCIVSRVQDGKDQLSRRLGEGMWRGAGNPEACHSQDLTVWAQRALRQLIRDLTPKSSQWELSRLVILSTSVQRKASQVNDAAYRGLKAKDRHLPFLIAADLEDSSWRSLFAETQAEFAVHAANALDADASRALAFEFGNAVDALFDTSGRGVASVEETQSCCLLRERVNAALIPSTEVALAALNYFTFSSLDRRRTVLRQLCDMVVSESLPHPTPGMLTATWVSVYFDALYERATCIDEGLWVASALAAVEAGVGHLNWIIPALHSLIAASSTQWKRNFLRYAGQLAKRNETQGRVRDFFAGASDRFAALHVPPAAWKSELLVDVTLVFSV